MAETDEADASAATAAPTATGSRSFSELLRYWEEQHTQANFDPTEIFHQMSEILEKETRTYIASDPDPFEIRHPSRVDNTCKLGHHLKSFFKRDNLVKDLFSKYMRDNFFTRQGLDRDSTQLNIAACRLLIDIMPGLEISNLQEQEGMGSQLYRWTEEAEEPLKSYAIGILANVMEYHEFASDPDIRERNSKLVPVLLKQLKQLQQQAEDDRAAAAARDHHHQQLLTSSLHQSFKRPFAMFATAKSPSKRRPSQGADDFAGPMTPPPPVAALTDRVKNDGDLSVQAAADEKSPGTKEQHGGSEQKAVLGTEMDVDPTVPAGTGGKSEGVQVNLPWTMPGRGLNTGWPMGLASPSYSSAGPSRENSNSSWAEMEINIIGHYDVYPISLQTRQIFLLRMLTPIAEYQDFVPMAQESQILNVVKKYLNVKETRDARLGFEACRLLGSLFCHKKYTLEWVYTGGLELLMEMPRPSIAATGSSLCIYYLACDSDTMEKICSLPTPTLERLVKYCLWLLECSHMTGRQYAIMFFGLAVPYLTMLDIFDRQDGLRRLYNSISTLDIFREDVDTFEFDDDMEYSQRQMIRSAISSIKAYAEAHLSIRKEKEVAAMLERDGRSPEHAQPSWVPYKPDQNQVTEQIDTLMKVMNYRARWPPIDEFIKLGGVSLLLKVIVKSTDWNAVHEDSVKNALDILAVCCILPRVQLTLCESLEPPDNKNTGMDFLLACAEGEYITDTGVQKAALLVLCHLLCAPIIRPGNFKEKNSTSNGTTTATSRRKSSEEVINTVWECFRSNNGIMAMLQLIQTKIPLSDADRIRALACQALVGLARSTTATQIMSKLPIFNNGVLTMLVREPVLQDNIAEHQKFQKHAQELLAKVSSNQNSDKSYSNADITLDNLHRAAVVANTKIRFNNKQLYQLIHEHLLLSGLKKTAESLRKEAEFVPLLADSVQPVYDTIVSSTTPLPARRLQASPPPKQTAGNGPVSARHPSQAVTPLSSRMSIQSRVLAQTDSSPSPGSTPSAARSLQLDSSSRLSSTTPSSQPIRIVRTQRTSSTTNSTPSHSFNNQSSHPHHHHLHRTPKPPDGGAGVNGASLAAAAAEQEQRRVTLSTLVCDYLSNKHANCKNPMTTCPEFDLFLPHKCPDKRSRREAPINIYARSARRQLMPPFGGPGGGILDRKLIYSRFRPVKSFRPNDDDRVSNIFTCCAFSGDGSFLMAGTSIGDMKMYNISNGEETTYQMHESSITHIQPSHDGSLVLTSSSWRKPYSKLWSMGDVLVEKSGFTEDEYVEFSRLHQDKVIGTRTEGVATVYDLTTNKQVRKLVPRYYNDYHFNRACFDPSDELILCDGVLWDYRMEKEIHKFDKLNQNLSGVFHPSGLEIISNTEVWDIRTFHLQRTVPQLDQCKIVFNNAGNVIFGLQLEQEYDDEPKFETSFRTFDCSDYSSIATIEVKKAVIGLCPSWDDTTIGVVEQGGSDLIESVVRLYDVGRCRDTEEDQEDGGEEEGEEDADEFSEDDDLQDDDDLFGSNSDSNDDPWAADPVVEEEDNDEEDDEDAGDDDQEEDGDEDDEQDEDGADDDDDDAWEDILSDEN